jgi:hypothetical protein
MDRQIEGESWRSIGSVGRQGWKMAGGDGRGLI